MSSAPHPDTQLLRASVPPEVHRLCERLRSAGHRSWVVGGCVRDLLLASSAQGAAAPVFRGDWDIATDARPEQVRAVFRRVIPTGIQHGTVTVLIDGRGFELTTLRGETTYSDGRHPDSVYFVDDIRDDLARRDFTINAMAWDPIAERLIDPFGGVEDLRARRLRAVGDPAQRFAEDGLRVLRAARFVATLEVELDPDTAAAIRPSLSSYARVSAERVRDEWIKSLEAAAPSRAFRVMLEHGLLEITAPELLPMVGCAQNRHHAHDVWTHTLCVLDACPRQPVLRMAALLHDVAKPQTRSVGEKTSDFTFYDHEVMGGPQADELMRRLRFSNEERERVVRLVRHHIIRYDDAWSDATVRRWLQRVGPDLVEDLILLNRADVLGKGREVGDELDRLERLRGHVARVVAQGAALGVKDLAVNGTDLMGELALSPGPVIGELLRRLLEEVLERPELNQREALLARSRELLAARSGG